MSAGVEAGALELERWVDQIAKAVDGKDTEAGIRAALDELEQTLPLERFAQLTEEQLLHGAMLGALDGLWERESDEEVPVAAFRQIRFRDERPFAQTPFGEAMRLFDDRMVLPREQFDALREGMKRRAFTVAGLARQELLETAHAELARQIRESEGRTYKDPETDRWVYKGPNLREFKQTVRDRLESAGWTPSNPSHVETIYRTNVASAYSSGRFAEMTQPAVLAARPYWQIRTVKDSRQRRTHRKADGIILPADHPFWQKAFPPFGYQCRCRVISRSQRWVDKHGARIGPVPQDLPDPGFDSGTTGLVGGGPVTMPTTRTPAPAPTGGRRRRAPSPRVATPPPGETGVPPARPPLIPAPPAPVPGMPIAGRHFGKIQGKLRRKADQRRVMSAFNDVGALPFLEQAPLERLLFTKRRAWRSFPDADNIDRGVNGVYITYRRLGGGQTYHQIKILSGDRKFNTWQITKRGAAGWSVSEGGATEVESIRRTVIHELGHHVHLKGRALGKWGVNRAESTPDFQEVDAVIRKAYARRQTGAERSVSQYAMNSPEEYFAESFALYHEDPAVLKARDPGAFQMVETVRRMRKLGE